MGRSGRPALAPGGPGRSIIAVGSRESSSASSSPPGCFRSGSPQNHRARGRCNRTGWQRSGPCERRCRDRAQVRFKPSPFAQRSRCDPWLLGGQLTRHREHEALFGVIEKTEQAIEFFLLIGCGFGRSLDDLSRHRCKLFISPHRSHSGLTPCFWQNAIRLPVEMRLCGRLAYSAAEIASEARLTAIGGSQMNALQRRLAAGQRHEG